MGRAPIAEARERRAVELFQAGQNFTQIAEAVGFTNRGTAYETVMRAIKRETVENVDEIRAGELSRIVKMIETSWPTATATISTTDAYGEPIGPKLLSAMVQNQLQVQATVLKLMERRARYIGGPEAPAQLDLKAEVTTPDQFAACLLGARKAFDAQTAPDARPGLGSIGRPVQRARYRGYPAARPLHLFPAGGLQPQGNSLRRR